MVVGTGVPGAASWLTASLVAHWPSGPGRRPRPESLTLCKQLIYSYCPSLELGAPRRVSLP